MAAVRLMVLALCVVLVTRLQPTRCQSAGALSKNDPADSQCDEGMLTIIVSTYNYYYIYEEHNNLYEIEYETQVQVQCFSGLYSDKLTLAKDEEKLLTEKGIYTIWVSEVKLDLKKSVYVCHDVVTSCRRSVIILGKPALKVISDKPFIDFIDGSYTNYTMEYGSSMTVSCSAPASSRLIMTKDGEELKTEKESENTIKYYHSKPDLQISKYVCTDAVTATNSSVLIKVVPLLYIQSRNETILGYKDLKRYGAMQDVDVAYGDSIEIFCNGSRDVKLISTGEYPEVTVKGNETVVQLFLNNLKLGSSVFSCSDSKVPDFKNTVRVNVKPRMDVRSPNVRLVGGRYIVKYGDPVEIICCGLDVKNLTIYMVDSKREERLREEVQSVNETAIRYYASLDDYYEFSTFECSTGEAAQSVIVGFEPKAVDFSCVSHQRELYLNCSWKALPYSSIFTLSYIENGMIINICKKIPKFSYLRFCIWDYEYYEQEKGIQLFSLLMQSCSDVGCFNETFRINRASITKLDPPTNLRVRSTSTFGVMLDWAALAIQLSGKYFESTRGDVLYKVVYWYSGIKPREVNSSLVSTRPFCEINLPLPCPATFYEVRVYQKLKVAIGEEFWSDPRTVPFVTHDNTKADDVESTCNSEPIETKEVMAFATQKLRYEVKHEMPLLKKEIVPLKDKLDIIRTLQEELRKNK